MRNQSFTLEFLTPCFLAGANQATAELRAPSVRGQLRWWFRALGGSLSDESAVFGGVGKAPAASKLIIRTLKISDGPKWQPPFVDPNASSSYVWYFASVSGKELKQKGTGPRWNSAAALAPKTKFRLFIQQPFELPLSPQSDLNEAIECFVCLGGLGLRVTRGLGAFACLERPLDRDRLKNLQTIVTAAGFRWEHRTKRLSDDGAIAREIGSLVKGTRKEQGLKADRPSSLGSSQPRQTSAIFFRPIRLAGATDCELLVLEAPHDRVLGEQARKASRTLVGTVPSQLSHYAAPSGGYNR
ncbi:MAG: type III-B CRISPR module RAMP protein Cmr1 [Verrucomicrobia bacterium]|nr:type III-B CRISPR module RAMP protein Cmr1 [Verrucomicrobiota bacterium]